MMHRFAKTIGTKLRRFGRDQSGSATLDFALMLPAVMLIFTSGVESGVLSTRHVMLEAALDTTVRDVRIGRIPNPSHEVLVERICEIARIIPDCATNVRLEMMPRDPLNWSAPSDTVMCVDRAEEGDPVLNFNSGLNNELMVLRACVLFDPMLPTTGLGKEIPKKSGGAYALVATSAYVMEPFQR